MGIVGLKMLSADPEAQHPLLLQTHLDSFFKQLEKCGSKKINALFTKMMKRLAEIKQTKIAIK